MFDMNDPDNKKAFITGLVVGDELNREQEQRRNAERRNAERGSSADPAGEGSFIGAVIGVLISAIVIVVAYVVLMR